MLRALHIPDAAPHVIVDICRRCLIADYDAADADFSMFARLMPFYFDAR